MAEIGLLDIVVSERRDDRRIIVNLPGRYSLADVDNARGDRRLFACRAVNLSKRGIALTGPVTAKVGVPVIAEIEQVGRLKGFISCEFRQGFVMSIAASDDEYEMLATKIDWLERHKNLEIADDRAHARFIPRRPVSHLTLADGSTLPCFVVDISVTGAAVSAEIEPKIGSVLAVGRVVGRVVRYFAEGFVVQFIKLQNRREVEVLVTRN